MSARAAALGLDEDVIELFMDAKVDTLSKYAFCSSYVPGQSNETEFLTAIKAIMKRDASVGELSCLRRLLHEAYSMSAAELKQVVERTEDMPAKKLAQPERAHRLDTQQRRLTGFKIEGPLEPADRLIDLVVQQYEENRVYHVDLHKCPSKEQEVLSQSSKEDRNITIDAMGNVRVKGKDAKLEADLASDLLLRNAFTRRALAYDQANLVDFVKLNSWTERLLQSFAPYRTDGRKGKKGKGKGTGSSSVRMPAALEGGETTSGTLDCAAEASACPEPSLSLQSDPQGRAFYAGGYRKGVWIEDSLQSEVREAALPSPTPNPSLPGREVPMFIEICAGSAILASCLREVGWDIIAIDNKRNRFHPLAKICVLDLSLDTSWEYLRWLCNNFPCGGCMLRLLAAQVLALASDQATMSMLLMGANDSRLGPCILQLVKKPCIPGRCVVRLCNLFPVNLASLLLTLQRRLHNHTCSLRQLGARLAATAALLCSLSLSPSFLTSVHSCRQLTSSAEKFLRESVSAPHPFFDVLPLSDSSKKVLFEMLTKGPAWVASFRAETLKRWTKMADDLKLRELELHKSLDPKIRAILKGKRLLLWRKIAEEVRWPDMTLFDQIEQGFELVGHRPASGIFPLEMRPAEQTPEQLMRRSGFLKSSLLQKVSSAPRNDDADELRRITMKEVEAGSLDGPHPPEVMDGRFPEGWIPIRRFGVWQSSVDKTKLRRIDDFAEAEVNSAFAYVDKLDLRSIDTLAAMLRWWTVCCDVTDQVKVSLSDGTCLEGSVHHAWKDQGASAPLLSAMDLRNAYKPGGGVECYESQALPFGATASVVDFNRFARFLHHVGECLLVPWVNYFDDYPVWTPSALARSTDLTLRALVELMGVDCAWDKMPAFSPVCPMLGIELDVSDLRGQGLLIRNKPGR
ncbi:unnamed protein product, partial [Symbiodinium necroappetens]